LIFDGARQEVELIPDLPFTFLNPTVGADKITRYSGLGARPGGSACGPVNFCTGPDLSAPQVPLSVINARLANPNTPKGACPAHGIRTGDDCRIDPATVDRTHTCNSDTDCPGVASGAHCVDYCVDDGCVAHSRGCATSAHAACVKSTAGALTCWGDTTNPVVSQAPTSVVTSFALNSSNGCFIGAGGAVQCWGAPLPTATAHTDFANVYTGVLFSCGITLVGDMTCWTFSSVATPKIAQLAIGAQFACGIETNGHAFCFDNQTNDPAVVQPPAGASFAEVAVGESLGSERACGIEVDGSVVCWGTAGDAYVRSPPDPIKAF
jgi:hypothetical protein